jgi:hypothetical protein
MAIKESNKAGYAVAALWKKDIKEGVSRFEEIQQRAKELMEETNKKDFK